MKVKALPPFKSKLLRPCRKLLLLFRFKLKRPVFIKRLGIHPRHSRSRKAPSKNRTFTGLLGFFRLSKQSSEMDRLMELRSPVSEPSREKKHFPSPLTPAYIRASRKECFVNDDVVEDACKSFENYLVEMIVEEGKVKDLMDVEELLYCWKNLKCPVFIDLVCRFYGELCKDLFAPKDDENDIDKSK